MADDDYRYDHDARMARLIERSSRANGYDGQEGAALTDWQDETRRELRRVLGFPAIEREADGDLEARHLETTSEDGYERQKWSVRTEPDFRVPFYLLLPDDVEPPYPVALTVHGHTDPAAGKELTVGEWATESQRREIVDDRRDLAIQAVERGYAALAPDMRAFGELADPLVSAGEGDTGDSVRACTRLQKHAQLLGRTLAGERTWDVLRLVDFVETRPSLDDERIAITGHSGGGAVTLFAAALDTRLSPVAPNAYVCTFADSIVAIDHCECNYVPGVLRLGELWDIAGLVAPRPMVVTTGADDPIFPLEGTERAFSRIREIYRNAGAEDACELHVGDGGHRYYPDGVWPFLERHM